MVSQIHPSCQSQTCISIYQAVLVSFSEEVKVTDFYPADFNLTAALTHEPLMPLEKAFGQNHASEKNPASHYLVVNNYKTSQT